MYRKIMFLNWTPCDFEIRPQSASYFLRIEKIFGTIFNEIPDLRVNSQAIGMDSWVQSALKSILRADAIFDSAAWFFVIILKFIFTTIFEIKIQEKKILDTKKKSFSKADFYKATDS